MDRQDINIDLKNREIKRLTTPVKKKIFRAYDCEGNRADYVRTFHGKKYFIEPKKGILTDDEILKYASESLSASKIRLKRGIGDINDKKILFGEHFSILSPFYILFILFLLIVSAIFSNILLLLITGLLIVGPGIYVLYTFHIKNYTEIEYRKPSKLSQTLKLAKNYDDTHYASTDSAYYIYENQINDLKKLYEIKENFAAEVVEKRFTPPQLTYDLFMSKIETCNTIFNNQAEEAIDIIKLSSNQSLEVNKELDNKIKVLKYILNKLDNLTNELVINLNSSKKDENEINNLLEDMDNLIDSVKDYN